MHNSHNCFKNLYSQIIIALITMILASVALWSVPLAILFSDPSVIISRRAVIVLLMPALLLGFHYYQALAMHWRSAFVGFMLAVIIVFGLNGARIMRWNILHPPEFDILQFWLHGRVAAEGLNFYEIEHALKLAQPFQPSEAMISEFRFWYPPPTMFLFLPLGWFNIQIATLLWYAAHTAILIADIFLLWQIFLNKSGRIGLIFTATLFLTLHSTLSTIVLGQLNFIVLLMLLLFWRDRKHPHSGVWLALAIFTKPFMAIILLYLLLRRQWQVLAGTCLAMAVFSVFAILVFGPATFFSYFTVNPAVESTNNLTVSGAVSWLGVLSRLNNFDNTKLFTHPIYTAPVLLLIAITSWLIYRPDTREDWALALTLPLALLIYPITGEHYCVVLLAPIFLLWMHRHEIIGGVWSVGLFITVEYVAFSYQARWSIFVFFAILIAWLVLAAIGSWVLAYPKNQPQPARV